MNSKIDKKSSFLQKSKRNFVKKMRMQQRMKISKTEAGLLIRIPARFKYIAMNSNGSVNAYTDKPVRNIKGWEPKDKLNMDEVFGVIEYQNVIGRTFSHLFDWLDFGLNRQPTVIDKFVSR